MSTLNFAGTPDRVASMLIDPVFAERLGEEADANNVTTSLIDNGLVTVYSLPTPETGVVRVVLGAHMTWTQTLTWAAPAADGARSGRLTMTLNGVPAGADGTLLLSPTAAGSSVVYEADVVVRIPLAASKIEQAATKYLSEALGGIQKAGNAWLDGRTTPGQHRDNTKPVDK